MSADAREKAERMLANGEKHMEQGNIGAARSFLQRAAEAGLAEAALKLGGTYDPAELARVAPLLASSADPKEAKIWYERARDLGASEAVARLMRLGAR
jgi:TPR repeat protein